MKQIGLTAGLTLDTAAGIYARLTFCPPFFFLYFLLLSPRRRPPLGCLGKTYQYPAEVAVRCIADCIFVLAGARTREGGTINDKSPGRSISNASAAVSASGRASSPSPFLPARAHHGLWRFHQPRRSKPSCVSRRRIDLIHATELSVMIFGMLLRYDVAHDLISRAFSAPSWWLHRRVHFRRRRRRRRLRRRHSRRRRPDVLSS